MVLPRGGMKDFRFLGIECEGPNLRVTSRMEGHCQGSLCCEDLLLECWRLVLTDQCYNVAKFCAYFIATEDVPASYQLTNHIHSLFQFCHFTDICLPY